MSVASRRLPLVLLAGLAVLGGVLVLTSGDDGVALEAVTTAEGVAVDVPEGWVVSPDFDFQYVPPPGEGSVLDVWSVAWACPPGDCVSRLAEEWSALAPDLPTFTSARTDAGTVLFDVVESGDERSWVLSARTDNGLRIVNVAVFADGAERYLACNLVVADGNTELDDAIVDACRAADPPG